MNDRSAAWFAAALLVYSLVALGCGSGGSSGRPDLDAIPEVERRAEATKADIYQFRSRVRKGGVNAAKQDLPDLIASLENYEKLKLGEHKETYKQIFEKLKALEGTLGGSATKDAVVKAVDEIGALADKLPGKANANPVVE